MTAPQVPEKCAWISCTGFNCKKRGHAEYLSVAEPTDNGNVNIVKYKGDYYLSTETNLMHRVNPENLETLEQVQV